MNHQLRCARWQSPFAYIASARPDGKQFPMRPERCVRLRILPAAQRAWFRISSAPFSLWRRITIEAKRSPGVRAGKPFPASTGWSTKKAKSSPQSTRHILFRRQQRPSSANWWRNAVDYNAGLQFRYLINSCSIGTILAASGCRSCGDARRQRGS